MNQWHYLCPTARYAPVTCIHSSSDKCITAWHQHFYSVGISCRIPPWGSLRHRSLLRIRPSAEATAEDHRCRLPPQTAQAATRMRQPTSNQHGYPWVCAKRREARADLSYPCLSSRAMLNFLLAIISAIYNVKFCAKKHIMYHLYNT